LLADLVFGIAAFYWGGEEGGFDLSWFRGDVNESLFFEKIYCFQGFLFAVECTQRQSIPGVFR